MVGEGQVQELINPSVESGEIRLADREAKVEREALDTIRVTFENSDRPDQQLFFHNSAHTEGVVRRGMTIVRALREADPKSFSDHETALVQLALYYHDIVQNANVEEIEKEHGPAIAEEQALLAAAFPDEGGAPIGKAECASIVMLHAVMRHLETEAGTALFAPEDYQKTREMLWATIVKFAPFTYQERDSVGLISPFMVSKNVGAAVLALADTGALAMDGYQEYRAQNNALFFEVNRTTLGAKIREKGVSGFSEEEQEEWREKMLNWIKGESSFFQGRLLLREQVLSGLPDNQQEAIAAVYPAEPILEMEKQLGEVVAHRETLSFIELAKDMEVERFYNLSNER